MAEKTLWRYIKNNMRYKWDACRHEDKITAGIPDISFGINGKNGWIELKEIKKLNKGNIKLNTLTLRQRLWLQNRSMMGGNCWVLVRALKQYLLFEGYNALKIENDFPKKCKIWKNKIDWKEFIDILTRGRL